MKNIAKQKERVADVQKLVNCFKRLNEKTESEFNFLQYSNGHCMGMV
jgi:hypothetical protein